MAKLIHLERQSDTEANVRANLDLLQLAILSDQSEELTWMNDDASKLKYAAIQKHWNGAAIVYEDNDFGEVTLHGDLLADEYIKLSGATTNRIRFENGKLTFAAAGVDAFVIEDDRLYSDLQLFSLGTTSFEDWNIIYDVLQLGDYGALFAKTAGNDIMLATNMFEDGAFKYRETAAAALYRQNDGVHYLYSAPSGTTQTAISMVELLRAGITADGILINAGGTTSVELRVDGGGASNLLRTRSDTDEVGIKMVPTELLSIGTPTENLHIIDIVAYTAGSGVRLIKCKYGTTVGFVALQNTAG